ncbi:hypothetical protein MKX01_024573, partial [Papaver californicum]
KVHQRLCPRHSHKKFPHEKTKKRKKLAEKILQLFKGRSTSQSNPLLLDYHLRVGFA